MFCFSSIERSHALPCERFLLVREEAGAIDGSTTTHVPRVTFPDRSNLCHDASPLELILRDAASVDQFANAPRPDVAAPSRRRMGAAEVHHASYDCPRVPRSRTRARRESIRYCPRSGVRRISEK